MTVSFRLVSNYRSLNYLQRFDPFLFFVRFSFVVVFIYLLLKIVQKSLFSFFPLFDILPF